MNASPQIADYTKQIQQTISLLQEQYHQLAGTQGVCLSPTQVRQLRQLSKRLNEYCADLMAYQEKMN